MEKLLYNRALFVITSILVLIGLALQAAEYIDLPIIIIPSSVLYIIWLFILIKNKNTEKISYEKTTSSITAYSTCVFLQFKKSQKDFKKNGI